MEMKLRNKKTGEITDNIYMYDDFICVDVWKGESGTYDTLAELNEDWEDYKPAEPLIKDEKIRKAVRAWAELLPDAWFRYTHSDGRLYTNSEFLEPYSISFPIRLELDEMTDYTIAELCGEEEE